MKTDQDCVQLHAWLSVFLKGKGAFSEFVNGEHEKLRVKEQMELLTAKEAETLHRALRILDEYEPGDETEIGYRMWMLRMHGCVYTSGSW